MTVEKLKIEIKDYEKLIIDIENDIGKNGSNGKSG